MGETLFCVPDKIQAAPSRVSNYLNLYAIVIFILMQSGSDVTVSVAWTLQLIALFLDPRLICFLKISRPNRMLL